MFAPSCPAPSWPLPQHPSSTPPDPSDLQQTTRNYNTIKCNQLTASVTKPRCPAAPLSCRGRIYRALFSTQIVLSCSPNLLTAQALRKRAETGCTFPSALSGARARGSTPIRKHPSVLRTIGSPTNRDLNAAPPAPRITQALVTHSVTRFHRLLSMPMPRSSM